MYNFLISFFLSEIITKRLGGHINLHGWGKFNVLHNIKRMVFQTYYVHAYTPPLLQQKLNRY